jgi:uncharacterized protein YqhQ
VNNRIDIKGNSNVVREQVIEINLADLPVEAGVDTVKIKVTAYTDNGRPRSRMIVIPGYMLESATTRGQF